MSDDPTPSAAGWYPQPNSTDSHSQVRYWDGTAWVGIDRRANRAGTLPRDTAGLVALIILIAGFVLSILIPLLFSVLFLGLTLSGIVLTVTELVALAATPVAVIVSIIGLVRAHERHYKAPFSLVVLIVSGLGTVLLVLPLALLTTGVWALHI